MLMHSDSQILVQDVDFSYEESSAPVLTDVSASVRQGEFVAVLGHNGSGKSTLAKLINALYVPGKGNVIVPVPSFAAEPVMFRTSMITQTARDVTAIAATVPPAAGSVS